MRRIACEGGHPVKFSCFVIGEDALTLHCSDMLLSRGHQIHGLVSQNPELSRWANERNVALIPPDGDLEATLEARPVDYLFSIANLQLLPKKLVAMARAGAINFHNGPLPRYAGIHATSWALMNRERTHGITWRLISDVVDGGKILKQRLIEVDEGETAFSLNAKCFEAGIETFAELIEELSQGTLQPREQDVSRGSYFGMWQRPEGAGIVSWSTPAAQISALVRALDFGPYPNAIGRSKVAIGSEFMVCREVEVLARTNGSSPGT